MRCEIPTPRRCCFCFPLRIGLLIVGYIKLILSALVLIYTSINLYVAVVHLDFSEHYVIILMTVLTIFNSIVDVVFHSIFLIGAHKKNYRKIRMYFRYSIYNVIALTVIFCINMGLYLNIFVIFFLLKYVIFVAMVFLWTIIIQIYLILLVRSEFLKLKGDTQFEFINNEAEARCSATIKISDDLDDDNDNDADYDKISV